MLKTFLRSGLASLTLMLVPLTAMAADLARPSYKSPSYVAPAYSTWNGFYVGGLAGYGWGRSDWSGTGAQTYPSGGLFGGTVGYNYQTGSWLWGVEGDIAYSGMKDASICTGGSCETKNTWLGTARGRIGYTGWGRYLPYITGGVAFGGVKATHNVAGSASSTRVGYALGLGGEYMVWDNWSVKAEYLYVDLGKKDCGLSCSLAASNEVPFKAHLFRVGVNYHF